MALSNSERQALYRQRLKEAATPAWIRKEFDRSVEARETIGWFQEFFPAPVPAGGELQVYSRRDSDSDMMSLLVRMPYPLGEVDASMMKGWRLAREDANDLGFWHREI